MDPSEIAHTAISMSADGGANFSPESPVLPTDPQTFVIDSLVPGTYIFRFVVVDVDGRRSANLEELGVVLSAPGVVTDVVVTIEE
jgi:hypothetical protein